MYQFAPDSQDPGTLLWTIVQLRRDKTPGGFHKALGAEMSQMGQVKLGPFDGRFWNEERDAQACYDAFVQQDPLVAESFAVRPFIAVWAVARRAS